jgi:maleate cis-trans isomerase
MSEAPVYGGKGRIGLIVPANNSVIEPEFWSVLPSGVAAFATRLMARGDLTPEAVHQMESALDHAVSLVAATGVDVIAYCDMVTTFIMEPGWNERTIDDIARRTGAKALSAWTALRDALARLGARRIALGTPYPAAIHALAPPFFVARGFEVGSHATLDIVAMREVPTVDKARLHAFVKTLDLQRCDVLVLLATDLPTFGCLDELEREFRLPILTSNQTLLWASLRAVRATAPGRPLGRIFNA